ncbi:uncharacterized protein EKO05_0010444 [Ascochyta rabiei]|uniref:uncharacterized protein n=1 Tax=Didymella rabiei TaxID=5454 RepID=UPI0021FF981F|nr:uncharacterized protein EKO05_0010444 [Ascochyta rabiei]UPX20204.1 hypothetical protein EKO05_0010444 [Ascochyta rabiei]
MIAEGSGREICSQLQLTSTAMVPSPTCSLCKVGLRKHIGFACVRYSVIAAAGSSLLSDHSILNIPCVFAFTKFKVLSNFTGHRG